MNVTYSIHQFAKNGNRDELGKLLNRGTERINSLDDDGLGPLHYAARNDHPHVISMLLSEGADPSKLDANKWTPLHWASAEGNLESLEVLVDFGECPNASNSVGQAPLHVAANKSIAEFLIRAGADIEKEFMSSTPLGSVSKSCKPDVARTLIDNGANIGFSQLSDAARGGCVEIAKIIINNGVDINDHNGDPILNQVISKPRMEDDVKKDIISFLIKRGANVNERDNHGFTPLHISSRRGYGKISHILLENGANIEKKDSDGWPPIEGAVMKGNYDIVKMLIENGANPNPSNKNGKSLLKIAKLFASKSILKILIESIKK